MVDLMEQIVTKLQVKAYIVVDYGTMSISINRTVDGEYP